MDFQRLKDMDLIEQVHIFGFTNIHTFGPNISLIRLFSLMLNCAKPRLSSYSSYLLIEIYWQLAVCTSNFQKFKKFPASARI